MKPTKKAPAFEIVMMRVDELRNGKADYNPRRISEARSAALRESLVRFGVVENLVWNKRTGRLVGGHQRVDMLATTGLKEAPVRVVDLDEVDERALNLALNGSTGDWDWDKLRPVLDEIEKKNAEALIVTGFSGDELESIRARGHALDVRIQQARAELERQARAEADAREAREIAGASLLDAARSALQMLREEGLARRKETKVLAAAIQRAESGAQP